MFPGAHGLCLVFLDQAAPYKRAEQSFAHLGVNFRQHIRVKLGFMKTYLFRKSCRAKPWISVATTSPIRPKRRR